MRKRSFRLLSIVTIGILLLSLFALIENVTRSRVRLVLHGTPGTMVSGFIEADGVVHRVTEIPFQFEARVRRLNYQLEPVNQGQHSVFAEIFEGGRRTASVGSSPGQPAIRGWLRNDIIGLGAATNESFDPDNDSGWYFPPK